MAGARLTGWNAAAGFLAALSLGLLVYMNAVTGAAFRALVKLPVPDFRIEGYEAADVARLADALSASPEAAALLRTMHLVPDMIFPGSFALLALLVLARFAPKALVFHRPLTRLGLAVVFAAPVFYAAADYAENIVSLMVFPPATVAPEKAALYASLLAALTRAKFMLFFITLILMARFSLFKDRPKPE